MKKMRIIRLKSERMRRIRSELRKLLLSAWWAREVKIKNTMDEIFEHCDPYYRNHIRESIQFSNIEVSLDEILEYGNLSHEDRLREMARSGSWTSFYFIPSALVVGVVILKQTWSIIP